MNLVQPIRDSKKLEAIKQYLKEKNERDYIFFFFDWNQHRIAYIGYFTLEGQLS